MSAAIKILRKLIEENLALRHQVAKFIWGDGSLVERVLH